MKIEDYGFLSDTQTGALVGRNGSVDWLCFPRFDSAACFAALLGERKNGRWLISPADQSAEVTRKYRGHTLILETTFETKDGAVRLFDTLKGLTYDPTGGIVAAATTSLPEKIAGVRNWDYRYCWLRDATFTLFALTRAGFVEEARSWRGWLLRAIAGSPAQMQILYGMHGERRLPEFEIESLAGYENSRPVRVGNAASNQFQLDVYGEVMSSMYHAQQAGIKIEERDWAMQRALMTFHESPWQEPDEGI